MIALVSDIHLDTAIHPRVPSGYPKIARETFQNLIVILISQNLFTCLKTLNFMFQGMSYVVRNHMSEKEYILH